tara:strand:- start:260 stop:2062 length:1803 start_codon:yes stop_codon:yes gene_type:complete
MAIERKLLGINPIAVGVDGAEAVSFDGSSDYLSRSSDMTGNADSKTFTFSCWYYKGANVVENIYKVGRSDSDYTVGVRHDSLEVQLDCKDSSLTRVLVAKIAVDNPLNTWIHLLVSFDLANTSNKHAYINDTSYTINATTYTNAAIDFTSDYISAAAQVYSGAVTGFSKIRMSNLFLDYTYRDLSVTANRRLFIDADGKPAEDQADLSPILYLPMKDAATAGSNSGTGGDFTVGGVLATASRGPNQDNCSASVFDGANDYLSSTVSGFLGDNILSASFVYKVLESDYTQSERILAIHDGVTGRNFSLGVSFGNAYLHYQLTSTRRGYHNATLPKYGTYVHIAFSVNAATQQGKFWVNGTLTGSFGKHNSVSPNQLINDKVQIGKGALGATWAGDISEVWISNTAIDLDTANPFWDSALDKPISVRKVIADTGVTPLIALPINASDAGNNLGSNADFTVHSGPFTGARGPSEYWARSAKVSAANYLTGSIFCKSLVKWVSTDSGSTWTVSYLNDTTVTNIGNGTDDGMVSYYFGTSENIDFTQEIQKLRFTDALGYPKSPDIDGTTVLYLDFTTTNFGLNHGTGGNLTTTGTITSGEDVSP